jgi:hypothetical protein
VRYQNQIKRIEERIYFGIGLLRTSKTVFTATCGRSPGDHRIRPEWAASAASPENKNDIGMPLLRRVGGLMP